jgi:MFS family permease
MAKLLHILQVGWGVILNFVMGGVVYGFASLIYILRSSEDEGGMSIGDDRTQVIFSVAISFSCIAPILMSAFIEGFGPRLVAVGSTFMFSLGCLIFGVSDIHKFGFFTPGLCLMAFAGPGIYSSSHYCLQNFPSSKGVVNTVFAMSFHASFGVFYLFHRVWWDILSTSGNGDSRMIFAYYAFFCMLTIVPTLFIVPDSAVPGKGRSSTLTSERSNSYTSLATLEDDKMKGGDSRGSSRAPTPVQGLESRSRDDSMGGSMGMSGKTAAAAAAAAAAGGGGGVLAEEESHHEVHYDKYRELSLLNKLCSVAFRRLALFFGLGTLWVNFYIGTVDLSLGDSAILPYLAQHQYSIIFSIILAGGCLAVPLVGYCMDTDQGLMGVPLTALVISVMSMLWTCSVLVEDEALILPSFVLYSLFRVFLYIFTFAYIQDVFGAHYSDVLMGVLFLVSGAVNLLSIPMAKYAMGTCASAVQSMLVTCDRGRWSHIFLLKLASCLYFFWFALQEWIERRHFLAENGYTSNYHDRYVGTTSVHITESWRNLKRRSDMVSTSSVEMK